MEVGVKRFFFGYVVLYHSGNSHVQLFLFVGVLT